MSLRIGESELAIALQDRQNFHVRSYEMLRLNGDSASELKASLGPYQPMGSAQTISCSFNESGNTLVPESIYREDHRTHYLDFNFDIPGQSTVESDHLILMEARNVYSLPEKHEVVSELFPQCRFFHESSIEIELSLRLSRMSGTGAVYLFFSTDFFRLVVVRDGHLQFANTFRHGSEMDVAYYVLYVFDQLNISSKKFKTYATGNVDEDGAELTMLREYIGPLQVLHNCELADLQFTAEKQGETQRLFTLFHQVLCAS